MREGEFALLTTVFVSSTFRDMHRERDALHVKVMPAINALAEQHGDSVAMCDLRWGIDTAAMGEADGARKVLQVCLDEIDRCRPYMIVILGDRYGWMPGPEMIHDAVRNRSELRLSDEDISVTALEIEYGALGQLARLDHTLFYFRELEGPCPEGFASESLRHRERLDAIKARIEALPGAHVRTYRVHPDDAHPQEMDAFARMVTRDLGELMQAEWAESDGLDRYSLDQRRQWGFAQGKDAQFTARAEFSERCLRASDGGRGVLIHGPSGCGKSTLVSHIACELRKRRADAVPIFCGNTSFVGSGSDILKYVTWILEDRLKLPAHLIDTISPNDNSDSTWLEYANRLAEQYAASDAGELYFLIDGIDQLIEDDIARNYAFVPQGEAPRIHFLLSRITPSALPPQFEAVAVEPLSREEKRQVVRGILANTHRELSEPIVDRICEMERCDSPLYISLLIQRLMMMNRRDFEAIYRLGDGMGAILRYQRKLIDESPGDISALSASILEIATEQVGGSAMREAALVLAVSRKGLRLSDLEALLRANGCAWSPLDAAAFLQYMGGAFIYRSDGRVDFAHRTIRQGFLSKCEDPLSIHIRIIKHLLSLPESDELRAEELIWHAIQADQKRLYLRCAARMCEEKAKLDSATADTIDCLLSDQGEWLIEVIKDGFLDPDFGFFTHFLEYHVFFGILNSRENLQVKLKITQVLLEAAQKKATVDESYGNIWEISVACDRLSDVHRRFDTPEHREAALYYSRHSLKVRERLMELHRAADTPEKRRQLILQSMASSGRASANAITDAQANGIHRMMMIEYERGLCVAHEDLAYILGDFHTRERAEEACQHIRESIRIREAQIRDGVSEFSGQQPNQAQIELAGAYIKQSSLLREMGETKEALRCCDEAIRLCKSAATTEFSQKKLCDALIERASVQRDAPEGDIDGAIESCHWCERRWEDWNVRQRTLDSEMNLAAVYELLGDLYGRRGGEADRQRAEDYYQRAYAITKRVHALAGSVETSQSVSIASERLSRLRMRREEDSVPSNAGKGGEIDLLAESYREAAGLLRDLHSESAASQLRAVYDALTDAVNRPASPFDGLTKGARERVIFELKLCSILVGLEVEGALDDAQRRAIVSLNEIAESLSEGGEVDPPEWTGDVTEALGRFGVTPESLRTSTVKRCYQVSGRALQINRALSERTGRLADRESLAVSLVKYVRFCVEVNPREATALNSEVLHLAHALYRATGKQQYITILAGAEMVRSILSQSDAGDSEASPADDSAEDGDRLRELNAELRSLREQAEACVGIAGMVQKWKIQKRIDAIEQEMRRLREDAAWRGGDE